MWWWRYKLPSIFIFLHRRLLEWTAGFLWKDRGGFGCEFYLWRCGVLGFQMRVVGRLPCVSCYFGTGRVSDCFLRGFRVRGESGAGEGEAGEAGWV